MVELELERAPGDRRLYVVGVVGSIRLAGFFSRAARAESSGKSWQFSRRGIFGRGVVALDETGLTVGEFEPRDLRRGGEVTWDGRALTLRPASAWRERYALADGETELALLDGKGWGRRPVAISVDDPAALEPGLLLFAAFVVRGLAEDAGAVAAATASTAATSG
jgi:hypothetical protein